ncbi:toxin glutamine deamidase domain-containing protein, partial [Micromonospora sp. DT62]|uniref:toxin glutamine deamidase domain-containing protein n=1 Tax=Micromonospora sp. DT62 TaxID=3416521 RepID=UPI003CF0ADDB
GEHFGREMAGEVMADQAARLATGQGLTSVEDAARAAASGARGSATAQADAALQARLNGQLSALAGMPFDSADNAAPAQPSSPIASATPSAEPSHHPLSAPDSATSRSGHAVDVDTSPVGTRAAAGSFTPPDAGAAESGNRIPDQRGSGSSAPSRDSDAVSAAYRAAPAVDGALAEARNAPGADAGNRGVVPAPQVEAPKAPLDPTLSSVAPTAPTTVAPASSGVPGPVSDPVPGAGLTAQNTSVATTAPQTTGGPASHGSVANAALAGVPGAQASAVIPTMPVTSGETAARTAAPQAWSPRVSEVAPERPVDPSSPDRTPDVAPHPPRTQGQPSPRPRTPEWYAARWAADQDAFERRRYRGHFEFQRTTHEQNRRLDSAARLRQAAERSYDEARWLVSEGRRLAQAGHRAAAERYFMGSRDRERWYHQQNDLAEAVLAGASAPGVVAVADADFRRINDDVGTLAYGAVETVDRSALTGDDHPPPIDRSRDYGRPGGLRPPLALHQTDIERQVPREPDGSVRRNADPREGGWFGLVNDGGPQADATRGINCIDCTLSMFDTWMHGRPRVAAPRTFDAYLAGDVTRPINGERDGIGRVEDITGGRFQRLCQPTQDIQGPQRQHAIDTGYRNLHAQLRLGGHGSFAFVINNWEQGGAHIWVALNQNGTILYLDPQTGAVSTTPLYRHHGAAHPTTPSTPKS